MTALSQNKQDGFNARDTAEAVELAIFAAALVGLSWFVAMGAIVLKVVGH